ncbi:MAG TPA: cation:proton antiporter [Polyangia bacterium]|jgi:Kef-type K+ transport system membrane component KefB/nucleotide-binding universal stress UspA family protein|nr:cation:proton antiporter [Polyangia bacterium]
MLEPIKPLAGHAVFLLLVQLSLLVAVARVGAELAKRGGLPAVVGELAAGIALGPTGFGHWFPGAFAAVFPATAESFHLLDAFSAVGMTMLLLLTGLETDLRLLRNLGRAALIASMMGMVLPFGLGFGLGYLMPASYLADPGSRILFSLFIATAMSISAMPVIAKILVDLDLTKRNIGIVILSAGVVDDTVGWLVLSLIAGAATRGAVNVHDLGLTLALLLAFIAAMVFVVYPILRALMRLTAESFRMPDSDLVAILVVTFLCAAATEWIGVHPVFGAFVAGVVLHQVPRIRRETVARLESVTYGVLAPVFLGLVGIKVNLWSLAGGGGTMLGLVLLVACVGKLVGCSLGAYWGGLRFWEAASIAVAMNARGAMEIVVATIGLSLGILTPQMFAIIVLVAIVTSFLAPLGLRLTLPRVRMTDDEARRIVASESRGAFDPQRVRLLLATSGGPNALSVAPLAFAIARQSDTAVRIVHVKERAVWWRRLLHRFAPHTPGNVTDQMEAFRAMAGGQPPELGQLSGSGIARAICEEARRGYDLILLGSAEGSSIGGAIVEEVVSDAPCHVAIMKAPPSTASASYRNILVPVDGSVASRMAVELALRYAEGAGADLSLAVLTERRPQAAAYSDLSGTHLPVEARGTSEAELERISVVFRASKLKPSILHLAYDPRSSAVSRALEKGSYDLVVLGAENRAIQHRLFFGYENERLIRAARVPVVVVVPNLRRLAGPPS